MLPGGRPLDPRRFYLAYRAAAGFLSAVALATYGLYVVREAGLSPLELVLLGTITEGASFLFEVPTGVIADVYSRRLSILLAPLTNALAFIVMAAVPGFLFVAAGSVLFALSWTFRSGALEAWLADEIGEDRAAGSYLRGAQFSQAGYLLGIPVGVFAATVDLQAPMLIGGAAHLLLALGVALAMSERGFVGGETTGWSAVGNTAVAGLRAVRGRPVLISIIAIAAIGGTSSEALDRLHPLIFLDEVGLPGGSAADEAIWFGIFSAGGLVGGIAVTELLNRVINPERIRSVVWALVALESVLIVAMVFFGSAQLFVVALVAYWTTAWVRQAAQPLTLAWLNRGLDPRSRATVLSLQSQADALGQTAGGPMMGLVATAATVRVAIVAAGLLLLPALPIFATQLRGSEDPPPPPGD
ncbi:MAG: MFS transporter [Dehalococcoidia bacterium]|jgi:MFS transporter, DHA3 family, tetracycline resistance protein|nr:MFS transporter [Dehalococcoidia bacterium]